MHPTSFPSRDRKGGSAARTRGTKEWLPGARCAHRTVARKPTNSAILWNPVRANRIRIRSRTVFRLAFLCAAISLGTDHLFHNDSQVGSSILLVATTANILSALFLWSGLKSYVRSQGRLKDWLAVLPI